MRDQGDHFVYFVFPISPKTQTKKRMLRSCFHLTFVEFRSAVSEEKSKMSQPIRGKGGHFVFPVVPKNTNLVEDVEVLLPVKFVEFRSAVSEEKLKMSQPIRRQGGHLVFPIGPTPVGTRGLKSRMCPPYPHACRKRRLKWGAVI